MTADPLHILKTVYGYDAFRGRQADIIRHVMAGNNAFVLMPTTLVCPKETSDPRPIKLPGVLAFPGSGHRKAIDIG